MTTKTTNTTIKRDATTPKPTIAKSKRRVHLDISEATIIKHTANVLDTEKKLFTCYTAYDHHLESHLEHGSLFDELEDHLAGEFNEAIARCDGGQDWQLDCNALAEQGESTPRRIVALVSAGDLIKCADDLAWSEWTLPICRAESEESDESDESSNSDENSDK